MLRDSDHSCFTGGSSSRIPIGEGQKHKRSRQTYRAMKHTERSQNGYCQKIRRKRDSKGGNRKLEVSVMGIYMEEEEVNNKKKYGFSERKDLYGRIYGGSAGGRESRADRRTVVLYGDSYG